MTGSLQLLTSVFAAKQKASSGTRENRKTVEGIKEGTD